MKRSIKSVSAALAIMLAILACNLPSGTPADQDAASTAAAQTVQAQLTQDALLTPTATLIPPATATAAVPPTIAIATTSTSTCDVAQFITDVTYPDGSILTPGQAFTKTWRFKNAGTCSWTPSYAVVFSSGNQMGGPSTQAFTGNVNPGQTIDISVNLTAPAAAGDYTGYWKLRNASGVLFAQFYVQIKVQALPPAIAQVVLNPVSGESGTVYEAAAGQGIPSSILAGDTGDNYLARGYMSFNISALDGVDVQSADLDLSGCAQVRDPFASLAGIWVGEVQYALPLDQSDYNIGGSGIVRIYAIPGGSIDVESLVQDRIDASADRFQIRLHPAGASDAEGEADYMTCNSGVVTLTIVYQ